MKCLTCLGVVLTLTIGFQADAQDQRETKPRGVQQEDNGPGGSGRGGRGGPGVGGPRQGGPGQGGGRPGIGGPGQGGP
ncbi:MAG TPA: hypothetical protein DEF45_19390, partial [Rhodopirellula sp.]|nr:hypothetical protein [Rhodopirellula sp.]